jgi:hypothetical protein
VPIAVSGERRSWLTDLSTAVLVASLRLSSSRSIAVASNAPRTPITRRTTASSGVRAASKKTPPMWRPAVSSSRTCSSAAGSRVGPSSIQQWVTPSRSAVSTAIAGSCCSTDGWPSRSADTSAANAASRRWSSASAARRRARAASALTLTAVTR